MSQCLIVIDGPAASGKGTLAEKLAHHYGFLYIDSGLLYRAVAYKHSITPSWSAAYVAQHLVPEDLTPPELRLKEVEQRTPFVACLPEVRTAVNKYIRQQMSKASGVVMDGRDGAREFPEAQVKIFLTASVEVRAAQRYLQRLKRGEEADHEQILADLQARDAKDRQRPVSPLVKADDAIEIDSTLLDKDQVFRQARLICSPVCESLV